MPLLSTLTEKTTLAGTEQVYLDDTGTDKRGTLANILVYTKSAWGAVFGKVTITQPASSATLTIANGKTATINNTLTLAGTDGNTHTLPSTNSTTLASLTGVETLTNKTLTSPTLNSPTMTTPVLGAATGTSLATTGTITSNGTAGIGYATGAGGTVTQATSRTTAVTLNKICGTITTNTTSLASGSEASFTVNNSLVTATDVIIVNIASGRVSADTKVSINAVAVGSFSILVANLDGGVAETGALVINFAVIKSVIS